MKRKYLTVESFALLFVGIFCLVFLMHQDQDPDLLLFEIKEPSFGLEDFPNAQFQETKMEWVSRCKENNTVEMIVGFSSLPSHIKNFLKYRHCRNFPLIIDSPNKCGGPTKSKEVFLLFAIKSSPWNYERRAIIRQTWGSEEIYKTVKIRRIFISGTPENEKEVERINQLLKIENQTYGNILQWDFKDTFFNLTLKQLLIHQWLEINCPGANFIFNGDDDIFVNTFNVITYLRGQGDDGVDRHLFVGELITNVGPIRESGSKYYVPEQITTSKSYPRYCGGGGILMSRYTCSLIYNVSKTITLFPIDDVYLGMCLEKAGLAPASHMGMRTSGVRVPSTKLDSFDPCYFRELLMVHRFVPYEILVMWKAIQDTKLDCGQKHSVYLGI